MSFPRLVLLALSLPFLTGACAGAAVTAVSYGADGASYLETGKSTSDHFMSMVAKKDCAFWRMLRHQKICRPRDGDKDPYDVDYNAAQRQPSEDGVAYAPPLNAATDAPASSWTADAYKPAAAPAPQSAEPVTAVAETEPPPPASKPAAPKPTKKKTKKAKVRKASPGRAASVP